MNPTINGVRLHETAGVSFFAGMENCRLVMSRRHDGMEGEKP